MNSMSKDEPPQAKPYPPFRFRTRLSQTKNEKPAPRRRPVIVFVMVVSGQISAKV